MTSKRDQSDLDDGEIPEPKRHRQSGHDQSVSKTARQLQNSGTDPTWGQKYVFSSYANATTIPVGEESDFEDDADAMSYLMSVRQEAHGIPHLLVAPKIQIGPQLPAGLQRDHDTGQEESDDDDAPIDRSIYANDTGGWYEDGAYIGAPDEEEDDDDEAADEELHVASDKAVREAYFASILNQYTRLRKTINKPPPPNARDLLPPSSKQTDAPPFGRNSPTTAIWSRLLYRTDPHPIQLSLMNKDAVLRILRVLLGGKFLKQGRTVDERTSRWLWALLARLPERGGLNHTEMGWVRDLGRRAVLLGRSLAEMAALREEIEDGGLGVNEGVDGSESDDEAVSYTEGPDGEEAQQTEEGGDKENGDVDQVEDEADQEEGEVDDDENDDVSMDMESDSSSVVEGAADLEDAKARLLAQLDSAEEPVVAISPEEAARERARMNMRATLNMVLTVAGEFYGQRDLLEFREPFVGM